MQGEEFAAAIARGDAVACKSAIAACPAAHREALVNTSATDDDGFRTSVLMLAVEREFPNIVAMLLRNGASVTAVPDSDAVSTGGVPEHVASVFRRLDIDHNGRLDYRELRRALDAYGVDVNHPDVLEVIKLYDDEPDGQMDLRKDSKARTTLALQTACSLSLSAVRARTH